MPTNTTTIHFANTLTTAENYIFKNGLMYNRKSIKLYLPIS